MGLSTSYGRQVDASSGCRVAQFTVVVRDQTGSPVEAASAGGDVLLEKVSRDIQA
jgi:hypothetical protein